MQQGAVTEATGDELDQDLTPVVGANLKRLRVKRGLSLERLAQGLGREPRHVGADRARAEHAHDQHRLEDRALAGGAIFRADQPPRAAARGRARGAAAPRCSAPPTAASCRGRCFPSTSRARSSSTSCAWRRAAASCAEPHAAGTTENLVLSQGTLAFAGRGGALRVARGGRRLLRGRCRRTSITTPGRSRP